MAENDLDTLHLPHGIQAEREIFDPVNAWPDAPARIVVQVNKMAGGVYQVGYDPETGKHWLRTGNAGAWGEWITAPEIPDPPAAEAASGEYETTDMQPRRGPGRPRKV